MCIYVWKSHTNPIGNWNNYYESRSGVMLFLPLPGMSHCSCAHTHTCVPVTEPSLVCVTFLYSPFVSPLLSALLLSSPPVSCVSWPVVMATVAMARGGYRRKETRTTDLDAVIFNSSAQRQWHTPRVQCDADGASGGTWTFLHKETKHPHRGSSAPLAV